MYHLINKKKKNYVIIVKKERDTIKEKELNCVLSLSFAYALHGWLDDARTGEEGEESILLMAEAVKNVSEKGILLYRYVTDKQKDRCAEVIEKITKIWNPGGEVFTVYINFCLAVLEDVLKFEKMNHTQRTAIQETADTVAGLLTQFDSDYDDIESAEKAANAFSVWKRNKF